MNIAIDINGAFSTSGISHYIYSLIENLAKIDDKNNYFLYSHFFRKIEKINLKIKKSNFKHIHIRIPETVSIFADIRHKLNITEKLLSKHKIDLFHGPANLTPSFAKIKSVLTMHHYFPEEIPYNSQNLNWKEKFYFKATDYSIMNSDFIISSSLFTKNSITKHFKIPEDKIKVVHLGGPSEIYKPLKNDDDIKPVLKIPEKFLLFLGPLNERKNLPGIIKALLIIKEKGFAHKLLIAGAGKPDYIKKIKSLISELSLDDRILFMGHLDTETICYLYNKAAALVYPSYFEGFGYPPLEAMACGCPVAASNATSIPEICGDAALFFNPHNSEEIALAIEKILRNDDLKNELARKGFERQRFFSWEKTAQNMISVYEKTGKNKS